jgi:Aspartyl/Asparaginyl beta-hydroxylase
MNRFITDPENYTFDDLQNYDWDVIQTNITVDSVKMMEWFNTVEDQFADCCYSPLGDMDLTDPGKKEFALSFIPNNLVWGLPLQWTLQWSYDRPGKLPFLQLADPAQFPEITDPEFQKKFNKNLPKYLFGMYETYYNIVGPECFEVTRLVKMNQDVGLRPHVDIQNPEFLIRMHLQIQIDDNAWWAFGEDMDRKYTFEQGRVYLYNTAVKHSARNESTQPWIMLHNNPTASSLNNLLKTSMHIG